MSQTAKDFLTRCFAPGETIALLLRRDDGDRPAQRIVRVEQVLTPRYLGWLAHENVTGANIYVAANPLRSGSRRRTKESIDSVRHLYIDIDLDGAERVAALRASDAVPAPTAILTTSADKYQVLCLALVSPLDGACEPAGSISCARPSRPGRRSCK